MMVEEVDDARGAVIKMRQEIDYVAHLKPFKPLPVIRRFKPL